MSGTALEHAIGTILEKEIFGSNNQQFQTSRDLLDSNIQGLVLSSRVIFKEMLDTKSPWQVRYQGEGILADSTIRRTAKIISDDLWELFQNACTNSNIQVFEGKISSPPPGWNAAEQRTALFDKSNKVFYLSTPGKTFNILRDEVTKKVRDVLNSRRDGDVTKMFFLPNPAWVDAVNNLVNRLIAEAGINVTEDAAGNQLWDGMQKTKHPRYRSIDNKRTRELKSLRNQNLDYEGAQLGHSFGALIYGASLFFNNPDDLAHRGVTNLQVLNTVPAQLRQQIVQIITDASEADANFKWERVFGANLKNVSGTFTLLYPQDKIGNQKAGGQLGDIGRRLIRFAQEVERRVGWANLMGSPSYYQGVQNILETIFLTGKAPAPKRYSTKGTRKVKTKRKIPVYGITGSKSPTKNVVKKEDPAPADATFNLSSIISIVNSRLHDKIRENMGKGGAKQILNYQTGRFARSAKLQSLYQTREKGTVGAKVKYMKHPYQVFEPKGHLYKAGRDPHGIIGRSIRQILQEEKIANLRRVKVTLNG